MSLHRASGKFRRDLVGDGFKIGHVQAPTTEYEEDKSTIHPAQLDKEMLWHNGIIKDFEIKRLQQKYNSLETWDTQLLLLEIISSDRIQNLSRINGSFACVFYDSEFVYLFRNEISPLYIDSDMNFSSVKFSGSCSLSPNKIFKFSKNMEELEEIGEFSTFENPYYFS